MRNFAILKKYFLRYKYRILLGLIALIIVDGLQLVIPRILKYAVDGINTGKLATFGLFKFGVFIVSIAVVIAIFRFFWRYFVIGTSLKIQEHLRNRFFSHLQGLSFSYFNNTKTGELMALATNDILAVRRAIGPGIVILTDTIFLTIASLIMMFKINIILTFYALIPLPLLSISTFFIGRALHIRFRNVQAAFAKLTDRVQENLAGIRVVKAFVQESFEIYNFKKQNQFFVDENMRLVKIWGGFFPLLTLLAGASTAIVLFWGGRQVIMNIITLGDFVAFTSYLAILTWPMMGIGFVVNILQRGSASMGRVNKVLNTKPEIKNLPDAVNVTGKLRGEIEFKDIYFRYSKELPYVLKGVNLKIAGKEQIAIVGRIGEGKSTLVNFIPRVIEPVTGEVFIDGRNIRNYKIASLRKRIGFVPQDTFLFSMSLKENIAFGVPNTPMEKIIEASKIAQIYDEIMELPSKFDTEIGERGVSLSGGQKQRVAIARAIIFDPDILILDDALSSVDTETEEKIINALLPVMEKRTTIIITHRISSVKNLKRIIVLDNGIVKEDGNHKQLMQLGGIYKNLYEKQLLKEKLERAN